MHPGPRRSIGIIAGVALALAFPVAATACTPDEYLTDEERASGRYDTTPPDYYYQSSDAPHTHGDTAAPAESPAGGAAPSEPAGDDRGFGRSRSSGDRGAREPARDRGAERSAPSPVASQPTTAAPAAPPTTAAPVVVAAADPGPTAAQVQAAARAVERRLAARRRAAARRAAARERAAERRERFIATHVEPRALRLTHVAPTAAAEPAQPRAASDEPSALPAIVAGLAGLLAVLAGLAAVRRRRRVPALRIAWTSSRDAEIEAELQELLAEERARRLAGSVPEDGRPPDLAGR